MIKFFDRNKDTLEFAIRQNMIRKFKSIYVVNGLCFAFGLIFGCFVGFSEKLAHLSVSYTLTERPPAITRDEKYNWDYSRKFNIEHEPFRPALSDTEFEWYMDLISVFQSRCDEFGLNFMLDSGSALGAYRHHGFTPWDDDIDVRMDYTDRDAIENALGSVPGHTLLIYTEFVWKFFHNENSVQTSEPWNWPFIDIFFSKVNETHFYDATFLDSFEVYPVGDILPVDYMVFENLIMPLPRNMESYLRRKYPYFPDSCISNAWSHKREAKPRKEQTMIPCERFFGIYPTVYRNGESGQLPYEELRLGHKVLYRIQRIFK